MPAGLPGNGNRAPGSSRRFSPTRGGARSLPARERNHQGPEGWNPSRCPLSASLLPLASAGSTGYSVYFILNTSLQLSLGFALCRAEFLASDFLVSRDFPVWGKPAAQFGVRIIRCLPRLILEVVSRLYAPKCLLEPAWPRLGPSQRQSVLEALRANFRGAVESRFVRRVRLGCGSCARQCLRHLGAGAARTFATCT